MTIPDSQRVFPVDQILALADSLFDHAEYFGHDLKERLQAIADPVVESGMTTDRYVMVEPTLAEQFQKAVADVTWFDWSDNDSDATAALDRLTAMARRVASAPAASPPASPEDRMDGDRVGPDDVLWVVNDMGELGVKIHGRCFFLYKGESLEYADGTGHDDGTPTLYREVGKREFGETVWPQAWIKAGRSEARYNLELVYTPGLSDGEPGDPRYQWAPLPVVAAIDAAREG